MKSRHIIGWGLLGVVMLLVALAYDWLIAGLVSNSIINAEMLPRKLLLDASRLPASDRDDAERLPACIQQVGRKFSDKMDQYFACEHVQMNAWWAENQGHVAGPWQCNPVSSAVYVGRDLPFTEVQMDVFYYAAGDKVGAQLVQWLKLVHDAPGAASGGMDDRFLRDSSPDLSFIDCSRYSIIRYKLS